MNRNNNLDNINNLKKIYKKYFEDDDYTLYSQPTLELLYVYSFDKFQKCLDQKANILSKCGAICLFQSILYNNYTIVSFLLKSGVSLTHKSLKDSYILKDISIHSMIHYLIKRKRFELFKIFFEYSFVLNEYIDNDKNCLHHCIVHNWLEPLYFLDQFKISFNILTKQYGYTPLMLACKHGHYAIVRYLLFQDIYTDYETILMDTAMSIAIENLKFSCVQLLLNNNVRVDEKSKQMLEFIAKQSKITYDELISFLEYEFPHDIKISDIYKMNTYLRIEHAIQ